MLLRSAPCSNLEQLLLHDARHVPVAASTSIYIVDVQPRQLLSLHRCSSASRVPAPANGLLYGWDIIFSNI
jgi:hypothetical protein